MAICAQCGCDLPESAATCHRCGAETEFVRKASSAAAVSSDDAAQEVQPTRAGRREFLLFVIAALAAGIVTLVLLMGRRASSDVVAASPVTGAAPVASVSAPAKSAAASAPAWSSEHQAQWAGNRRHSFAFDLPANNSVAIWLGRVRPTLVVRCVDKKIETFVFTGSAIKIEPQTEDHTVTFSFDGKPDVNERWPDSAEHDALFAPDGAAFAHRLTEARTMRFGYTPHNASPVLVGFRVDGLGPLMEPAVRGCGAKR